MLLSWLRLESRCYNSGFCFGAVRVHMHRFGDAAVTQSDDTDRMERKTTPAGTAATSEGGTLFVCGRVAVDASVCGVVEKHGSGRLLALKGCGLPVQRGFNSVSDPLGKLFGPLRDGLRRNTYGVRCSACRAS